jgi:hypothetical protein
LPKTSVQRASRSRIAILLAQLRRLVLPPGRDAPGLDLRFLGRGVALTRRRDQARIHDLARHRDVAGLADRCVEAREQRLDRPGPRQPLAEGPDRLRIRHPVREVEAEEAHERQPVVDQELGSVVGKVVRRLDHQHLEHHHRIERRPPALRPIAIAERRGQVRAEHLEVHHRREGLELVADVAQTTQPLFHVEQSRLPFHVPIPVPRQRQ